MNKSAVAMKYFDGDRGPDLRRRDRGVRKTFEVSEMWEVHKEITRLLLLGYKNVEIAERLGVSEVMVSYTRNSKVVEDKLEIMEGARDADTVDLSREIKIKAPIALALLEDVLKGEEGTIGELASPALRVKTAENWMDRAGYAVNRGNSGVQLHAHFDAKDITELKQRALDSGIVIDAEEVAVEG